MSNDSKYYAGGARILANGDIEIIHDPSRNVPTTWAQKSPEEIYADLADLSKLVLHMSDDEIRRYSVVELTEHDARRFYAVKIEPLDTPHSAVSAHAPKRGRWGR